MAALYDILSEAQGGQALDTIGRQYGLTPEQTEAALQALIPAFSEGLQRTASTPEGVQALLGVLSEQQGNRAFDEPLTAFGDQGRQTGNDALAALFGSKDVSRAVAVQAADFSGIAPEILKKMLPTIANVVISGLIRNMLSGRGRSGGGGGGLGDLIGGMLGGGAGRQGTRRAPPPRGRGRSTDRDEDSSQGGGFLENILGGGAGRSAPSARRGGDGNSLEDIFGPATPGLGDGAQASGGSSVGNGRSAGAGGSLIDILGDLLQPGKQVPEQNRRGMESIFDGFFGPKRQ